MHTHLLCADLSGHVCPFQCCSSESQGHQPHLKRPCGISSIHLVSCHCQPTQCWLEAQPDCCLTAFLVAWLEVLRSDVVGVATGLTERVWSACPSDFTILSTTSTVTPFSNSPIRVTGRVDACCHVHSASDFPTRSPIEWYHFELLLKRLTNCRA